MELRNRLKRLIGKAEKSQDSKFRLIGDPQLAQINSNVYFGGNVTISCNAEVIIEEYTMISHGVVIHTSTHQYQNHPMWTARVDKPVKIGKHVWIGINAIILPGVIIEDFAVIGAGAVVAKNVPQAAILVGNPARIIKYRNLDELMNLNVESPETAKIIKGDFNSHYYE